MRRFAVVFSGVLLIGVLAAGPSSAFAGPTDWAVNGEPLAPGQEIAAKFASVSPVQLIVPGLHIDVTCASWKAKATLVGGETGTGELVKPKLARCFQMEAGTNVAVKITIKKLTLRTDLDHAVGTAATTEFEFLGIFFRKGGKEQEIMGIVDSFGPKPEGNLVDFPQPSLAASTLTVGGDPAELFGEATFKLAKHATLSQVEP
ncbi:MAG: hypothetical protein ABSG93_13630 [Solirubrobacteraceae bacterium]|jgi:hypothetical protein